MTTFESVYKPARQGRKVAYLTMASFLFLLLALGFVLTGQHASQASTQKSISKTELSSLSLSTAGPFSNDPGAGGGS